MCRALQRPPLFTQPPFTFHSTTFHSTTFHSTTFHSTTFHSTTFHSTTFHFSPNHFSLPKKMVYSPHKYISSNDGYRRVRCTITDTEGANRALPTPDESLRSAKRYSDDPLESLTAPTEQPATRRVTLRSTDRVTWHLAHSCVMERRHLVPVCAK
jgi:hypothetical protein